MISVRPNTRDLCSHDLCFRAHPALFYSSSEYIFVVGGAGARRKAELVSMSEAPIPDCLATLANHPNEIYYGAGGALPDTGKL